MKDNIKLTKKEKLEAYDKILGDDEDYINSFFNTDKFQTHIYNEKDGNKPFFKGYKPPYYFRNTTVEEDKAEQMVLERLSTPTGVNLFEEQKNLYIVNYKYKEISEEKYQRDTILIKAFDDKDIYNYMDKFRQTFINSGYDMTYSFQKVGDGNFVEV